MAWLFDSASDGVTLADNAAATLPDGDWTLSFWVKQTSGTQAYSQRIYAANTITPPPVIDLRITAAGNVELITTDAGGDTSTTTTTGAPFSGNTSWTHVIAQRTGGGASAATFTIYINGSSNGTTTNNAIDAIDPPGISSFGNRYGGTLDRGLIGSLAEGAKWDRALDSTERGNLSNGTLAYSPNFYSTNHAWYVPMYSGDYTEKVVGITITNDGTTGTTHPAVAYPLQMPLLSVTPTLYAPTFAATYSLTAPLLDISPTLYAPTFVGGSVTLTAPLLNVSPTLYAPAFAPTYSLSAPLLNVTPTFYGPTFAATYSLTAPLLTDIPTFYGPTFVPGSVTLTTPLLTKTPTFYAPAFVAALTMGMPLLNVSPTLYAHGFFQASQSVGVPVLKVSPALYSPTLKRKWEDVGIPASLEWRDTDFPYQKLWE